jgi:hypothetical protein
MESAQPLNHDGFGLLNDQQAASGEDDHKNGEDDEKWSHGVIRSFVG